MPPNANNNRNTAGNRPSASHAASKPTCPKINAINATVAGSVVSDQNANVTAMAGSAADIYADLDADLFAGGDSTGMVWAGNNATVTVTGNVTGDVTADVAGARVSANGSITSAIDAGQNATVSALGAITGGTITAGASATATR